MDETDEQATGYAPPPPDAAAPPPAPVQGWRQPGVWMACGALLAALAGGAAVLAHRVSVERDMEQLARLLPPAPPPGAALPPAVNAGENAEPGNGTRPAGPPALPPVPGAGQRRAAALDPMSGAVAHSQPQRQPLARDRHVAGLAAVAPPPRGSAAQARSRPRSEYRAEYKAESRTGYKPGYKAAQRARQGEVRLAAKEASTGRSARSAASRRRAQDLQIYYSQIFRRCPQPGEPGAVECRRHICNGAESEGPACKPFRSGPP